MWSSLCTKTMIQQAVPVLSNYKKYVCESKDKRVLFRILLMSCSRRFQNTKISNDITLFMSKRRTNCHMSYFENCEFSLIIFFLTQPKFFLSQPKFFTHNQHFFLSQPKFFAHNLKFFLSQPKFFTHNQNFFSHNQNFSLTIKLFHSLTNFLSNLNFLYHFAINLVKRMKFSQLKLYFILNFFLILG